MKSDADIALEVQGIDECINRTRAAKERTNDTIAKLVRLNAGRDDYLRRLGQTRSELQTYELNLSLKE